MTQRLFAFLLAFYACLQLPAAQPDYAGNIARLIDPVKLATLGKRGANSRVQKCVYWLVEGREHGQKPHEILDAPIARAGIKNGPVAKHTKDALLRNLSIAEKLGCLDEEGLSEMRHGKAATVKRGPYKEGDQLSVGHIIPRSVVPELDNVIANLEPIKPAPSPQPSSSWPIRPWQRSEHPATNTAD